MFQSPPPDAVRRRQCLCLSLGWLCLPAATRAQVPAAPRLPAPSGPVLLTMTGRVSRGQQPGEARFDREMLQRLPAQRLETTTPWAKGRRLYEGPWLRDVLAAAGAQGTRLVCRALNDYSATLPRDDADQTDLMLALRIDGQPIRTRDKGPLLLIYPFDDRPDLRNPVYYGRAVWQLAAIEVAD
jgi:hypothetical protein